jgi:alpha-glucosidase
VPADWAETRLLAGEVGEFAVIARKDRASEDWYLGAGTDQEGREVSIPLAFLTPGKRYEARIYADGPNADFAKATRSDITITRRTVTAADRLTLKLAPGGGQAIRFRAM